MKLLFINNGMHVKNQNALFNYNITIFNIYIHQLDDIDLSQYDAVYSPCLPINVKKYPGVKFIFGPHFSVFPENHHMQMIQGNNTIYIQPSEWVVTLWKNFPICKNIQLKSLPFGVDINRFNEFFPIQQRSDVFVYFKARNPEELQQIITFLSKFYNSIKVFNYLTRYGEEDYLNCLKKSKFGVWVGRHESQGFALEEALACNVPLLVWDVISMNQEYGYNYQDIPATCIPYWDHRCGESFTNFNEFPSQFNKFINNLHNYKPREYVLENLSIKKCSEKFINIVNNI